eukprot:908155-Rhodomonas_salina.2
MPSTRWRNRSLCVTCAEQTLEPSTGCNSRHGLLGAELEPCGLRVDRHSACGETVEAGERRRGGPCRPGGDLRPHPRHQGPGARGPVAGGVERAGAQERHRGQRHSPRAHLFHSDRPALLRVHAHWTLHQVMAPYLWNTTSF